MMLTAHHEAIHSTESAPTATFRQIIATSLSVLKLLPPKKVKHA
jgi:hypothetical protein